jgi:fumarate reductase subunit C
MSRHRSSVPTYQRPMAGWWRRNAFFTRYMLREASALFVLAYALLWLVGLWRLSQGPEAFTTWLALLQHPLSLALHGLGLLFVAFHSLTWFQVMPKTMPPLPVPPRLVTGAGLGAALVASVLLFAWLAWGGR